MKKVFVLALVLILSLASMTPVAAKGGDLQLYGKVTAIDDSTKTFTMVVETPRRYAGDSITIQVTSTTLIKQCDTEGVSYRISFDDLEAGKYVRVTGAFVGSVYVATKVIQYVPQ